MSNCIIFTPAMMKAFHAMMKEYSEFLDKAIESGEFVRFSTEDLEEHKQRITEKYMKIEKES